MEIHPATNYGCIPKKSNSRSFARLLPLFLLAASVASANASVLFTNLFSFDGTNGSEPSSPLLQTKDGGFYGASLGSLGPGTIFHLSQSGVLETVASFFQTNGNEPVGPLAQAADGTIYGTTWLGGTSNLGTIFRLPPSGAIEILMSFNGTNGSNPRGLILGPDGGFYGVADSGGLGFNGQQGGGFGTVFRMDTNGEFKTLFTFNGTNGSLPQSLTLGGDGTFYGVTHAGGDLYASSVMPYGFGTVFKMSVEGVMTTLFSLSGTNGFGPFHVTQAADGTLYGVTSMGGANYSSQTVGYGTAFRLATNGVFSKLAEFNAQSYYPFWIVQAVDGNFYGTTFSPNGSVFQLTPAGTLTIVYDCPAGKGYPNYLTPAADGSIYGLITDGGLYSWGSIFRLTFLADPPLLQSVNRANGSFNFTWNASLGRSYQVQSAADLTQAAWANFGGPITATNSRVSFSSSTNAAANCLYRVVLIP